MHNILPSPKAEKAEPVLCSLFRLEIAELVFENLSLTCKLLGTCRGLFRSSGVALNNAGDACKSAVDGVYIPCLLARRICHLSDKNAEFLYRLADLFE